MSPVSERQDVIRSGFGCLWRERDPPTKKNRGQKFESRKVESGRTARCGRFSGPARGMTRVGRMTRYPALLLDVFAVVWTWAAIGPKYPHDWPLENYRVFVFVPPSRRPHAISGGPISPAR